MSITGDDYGPLLRTLDWTLFGASSIIVSLRMITRVWIIRKPGWDDATMALSQTLVAVRKGFIIEKVKYGLGRHKYEIPAAMFGKYRHFDYLEWLTVFLILALSKISFCLFLLRISQFNKLQKLLWALIAVVAAFTLPLFLVFLFQCQPIWKYWRREVEGYCVPKLTVMKIMVLQGCFSVITDLICAVIPSFLFRELRISRQSKTALCILMGLGVLTAAACTVRTSFSYQVRSDDVSWIGVPNAIARIVEVHTSNIAASAPILKPLYRYLRARWSGADPNKVIFRRAPPPSLSRWMTRFRITSSSKPDETEEKRRMQDTDDSSKSRKSSNREVSANQNLDLPLQGDPSNSKIGNNIDSIVNIEAGSHNDWPLSNEAPMHGVTQKRKQKHRTEGEVVIGSNTRSTTENAEDTCDDDLDFGSWKAPKKRQASQL